MRAPPGRAIPVPRPACAAWPARSRQSLSSPLRFVRGPLPGVRGRLQMRCKPSSRYSHRTTKPSSRYSASSCCMAPGTRDRLLDAVEQLLLERGAQQVTLEAVAAAAGVSKGGLLYHFKSKDALFAGMVRRLGERADQQLADAVDVGA